MLIDLQADTVSQGELDLESDDTLDHGKLMSTLDGLKQRFGKVTVLMASEGLADNHRAWVMTQERRTPAYTTCWEDLAVVRA